MQDASDKMEYEKAAQYRDSFLASISWKNPRKQRQKAGTVMS
ncbi:UvrB/UvrC motif-containing protein [Acidaminococcus intestini]|nr:UvrB/UvrC motif-containing protein [Acidaminococcus intestini]